MIKFDLPQNIDFSDKEMALKQMWSYVTAMQEQIEYFLRNLDVQNFNDAGLAEITAPVLKQISDVEGNVTELAITAEGLAGRVSDVEGDVTTVAITAQGASIMAQNAAGQAAAVALTVDGFTVYDPNTGKKTLISGDYIKSGTINGARLISDNGAHAVVIENGKISLDASGSYITMGEIFYDPYDNRFVIRAPFYTIPLKIISASDLSIDAGFGRGIYIGTSNQNEKVTIGNGSTEIRLVGDVYINGVKQ